MARQRNDQIPLGELLTRARLEKRLSRAQVAKATGVSENSIVRYEKAGLEPDGQFPPSPKLAALCFFLDINPTTALFSALEYDDYWKFKASTWESNLLEHPDYDYLSAQYVALLQDNQKLRSVLRLLIDQDAEVGRHNYSDETIRWLRKEASDIIRKQDMFENALVERGIATGVEYSVSTPGKPMDRDGNPRKQFVDYTAWGPDGFQTKNGSGDVGDVPSRSENSEHREAVCAASTSKPRKKRSD